MRFARIEMLFLIWAAPVIALALAYGMRRRRKALSRFASGNGLSVMAPSVSSKRRWAKGGLTLAALVFTAIALSGPQYGFRWQEIERRGVDLIIALDCSRSMLAQDLPPTRLDRAKREVQDLLAMLKGDRVGLAAFSGTAFLQCPLTLDYSAFNLFLDVLSPDYLPVGGTDITGALTVARNSFDPKSPAEKAVILITDGENTGQGDPIEAAEALEKSGIKLFCIGVGGEEGAPIPNAEGGFKKDREGQIVMTRLDEETLKKMAVLTGGTYVRSVAGDMDLDVLYGEEIRGKMETAALSGGRKQVWEDRFQWFLGMAVICLFIELFLRPVRRTAGSALIVLSLFCFLACLNPFPALAGPLEKGLQAYDQGDYETALKEFIDAQLDAPDRADILYNIGNAYYKLGDYDAALTHYRQALEKNPPDLAEKAQYNKGNAHFKAHDYEAAVKAYQAALELDPNDRQAAENLQFVRKVMEQQQQQKQQSQNGQDGDKNDEDQEKNNPEQSAGDAGKNPTPKENRENAERPENENGDTPQSTPEYGDEMADGRQPQPQPIEDDGQEGVQKTPPAAAQASQSEDGDREGAKRALNRLKDQPGRALMAPSPGYGRPEVEKDW